MREMAKQRPGAAEAFTGPAPGGKPPRVKTLVKDRLDWTERIGLVEILKGMGFTLREMLRPRFTVSFPEQKFPDHAATKGQPVLVQNDDGTIRCVSCGLCEFVCPARAITIDPGEIPDPIQRAPVEFRIDMLRCILCGMCEEACPEEAIVMSNRLLMAAPHRDACHPGLRDLLVPAAELARRIDFIKRMYSKWHRSEP